MRNEHRMQRRMAYDAELVQNLLLSRGRNRKFWVLITAVPRSVQQVAPNEQSADVSAAGPTTRHLRPSQRETDVPTERSLRNKQPNIYIHAVVRKGLWDDTKRTERSVSLRKSSSYDVIQMQRGGEGGGGEPDNGLCRRHLFTCASNRRKIENVGKLRPGYSAPP